LKLDFEGFVDKRFYGDQILDMLLQLREDQSVITFEELSH
jgi:hypothetical protein